MPDIDPSPVKPSTATDGPAAESPDNEQDPAGIDETDPKSPTQKRKMKKALDNFLRPT